jgi:hypothetical protein
VGGRGGERRLPLLMSRCASGGIPGLGATPGGKLDMDMLLVDIMAGDLMIPRPTGVALPEPPNVPGAGDARPDIVIMPGVGGDDIGCGSRRTLLASGAAMIYGVLRL